MLQIIQRQFGRPKEKREEFGGSRIKKNIIYGCRVLITFGLVSLAWVFFRADTIWQAFGIFRQMFLHRRLQPFTQMGLDVFNWIALIYAVIVLFAVDLFYEKKGRLREFLYKKNMAVRWTVYLLDIWSILLFGVYGAGYDASQFIYFQF